MSSDRKLSLGEGGGCEESAWGNHLGVNLSIAGVDTYEPLQSTQGDLAAEFTDGFTLELWVKPQKLTAGDTADRVLVSLSAVNPSVTTSADLQQLKCADAEEVSFQLIQKSTGCLVLNVKLISKEDCTASQVYEQGLDPSIPDRTATFRLPHHTSCASSFYSINGDNPGLDLDAPKLQHVVVSLSAYMGGAAGPGQDRGGQAGMKRFAVWVDGELKTSDEHMSLNKYRVYGRLFNNFDNSDAIGLKRTDGYNLATDKTKNFVPSATWKAEHVLHVGHDGTGDASSRWEGEVLMLAMYPRPLTQGEVDANFAAKLDNSDPYATDMDSTMEEDAPCAQLVPNGFDANDWDTRANEEYPSLGAASSKPLTYYVNTTLHPQRGTLYSDPSCATPLESEPRIPVTSTSLYYKAAEHEFSSGGPEWGRTPHPSDEREGVYATLPWTVEDGNGGSHSAIIRINVSATNDAPVAADGANVDDIYKGLGAPIFVTGSDRDGWEEANRLAYSRIRIKTTPMKVVGGELTATPGGKLYKVKRGTGSDLARDGDQPLGPGEETTLGDCADKTSETTPTLAECQRDGLGLWYISDDSYPNAQGLEILGMDKFNFSLIDADGEESENEATFSITVLSGLRAKLATEDSTCDAQDRSDCECDTCTLTVEEEALSEIELRGLNQGGGGLAGTDFVVRNLPSNGRLYQYDESATDSRGDQVNAGDVLTDDGYQCDGWLCKRVLYEGHRDYFNWPEQTYDGTDLNVTADKFEYEVKDATTTSAPTTVFVRVRNVNDAPVLSVPGNLSGTPPVSFVPEQSMKLFGGIILEDPDRDLGYYRVTLKLAKSIGKLTELAHKQDGLDPASWHKWQGDSQMGNVVFEPPDGLLGYCPTAVCSTGSIGGCSNRCAKGDGSQDYEMEIFLTPATLRNVLADLEFNCKTSTDNTLTITIQDFDDGEGAMDGNHLRADIQVDIFAVEEEEETAGCGDNSFDQVDGNSDGTVTAAELAQCGLCTLTDQAGLTPCSELLEGADVNKDGNLDSEEFGSSDAIAEAVKVADAKQKVGATDGAITYVAGVVVLIIFLVLCLVSFRRFRGRVAFRDRWGHRNPKRLRTRDMRLVVPIWSLTCFFLTIVLSWVRCSGGPLTFYRMDVYGDGECSDEIEQEHRNNSIYEVNGRCIAGIPQGFMLSHSMLLSLLIGLFFPLVTLEVLGRPMGRLLCAGVAVAWIVLLAIVGVQFKQYKQEPEPPWVFEKDGEEVLGIQWTLRSGEVKEMVRPRQGAYAAGIFTLLFTTPLFILFTLCVGGALARIHGDEEDSESSSDEEDRKKRRRKGGKDKRGRRDKKHKKESKSKSRRKREDSEAADSGSSSEDEEAPKKKPAPPKKPPPPKAPPPRQITNHTDVQVDETEWHYMDISSQQQGPVTAAQLREMYEDGTLFASTYVWCEDMDSWKELKEAPIKL